ncbi:DNA methyltransferase [Rhizobium ruizarguesonis]|uniref:DNA methyltransferase n=1 Tax=Rhizobium ruizarguesonis TaxID=2081791 RepID=UPI00103101C9|nr:DNA methyltransferase [Rhizobium ruizarguesonis]TBE05214.1 DNA methylase [Rhizobium ruizarguesonis]TBE86051.1 DNA methylase [Rhizobium ruizarguesonis]
MNDQLKLDGVKSSGPVECFGMIFPSEDSRRQHFLGLLAEKLKDPTFRNQEGFPKGDDDAILAISDPPYYTACPNPWLEEFLEGGSERHLPDEDHKKEPFAADVSEGKNDPIYNAHSYHTKVPHKAIMRYVLHYTQPGDMVFDGFCGTGMTGIAARLCGDRKTVESLGYRVSADGTILAKSEDAIHPGWKPFSRLGERKAILNDLSPAATFIAKNYNSSDDGAALESHSREILNDVESRCGWMYETTHGKAGTKGRINYTVWSDVFSCRECTGEIVFWDEAVDPDGGQVKETFPCPHCSADLTKRNLDRAWIGRLDPATGEVIQQVKQTPVLINYSFGGKRYEKKPDDFDLDVIRRIDSLEITDWFPNVSLPKGDKTIEPIRLGLTRVHHLYTKRSLAVFSALYAKANSPLLQLALLGGYTVGLRTARFLPLRWIQKDTGPMKPHTAGTMYIPSISGEQNWFNIFKSRCTASARGILSAKRTTQALISTGSASSIQAPDSSVDYIFLDPPFGSNLMYSELNFLWEAWLGVYTHTRAEAIESKSQGKDLSFYRKIMTDCFREAYRLLKPGRWVTVEFSNTQASVWNAIQTSLQEAGFVVANVSALDKKQGSFNSVNNKTSVKQDLVISAYKPNGGLEERFINTGGSEENVWGFVRSHLSYLPTTKSRQEKMEFITERDPRIIFDRMVAWFVRHNTPVPLSTQEFQAGLTQRFAERDGMVFLPEQVGEYDRSRAKSEGAPQLELFVSDERSAIDWLTDFLRKRPSTYQDLQPEFFGQLGAGWRKHEVRPELSRLLEDNFLIYSEAGDVPSQIHSYLSTNFKDLRSLEKEDPRLKAKAKDRWFVPDPSKARDLEQKRERSLLKEFEDYKSAPGRRLKEFRLEVLRAGFKTAWAAKDYSTIIGIAQKIPEEALQEDEKLLLWYDQALTRMEANA